MCWNKNNLQKRREYVSNYIKNNPIKYKESYDKRNKKIGKNIERYDKNCLICSKVFEDKTLNFNKKFCSKKCKDALLLNKGESGESIFDLKEKALLIR